MTIRLIDAPEPLAPAAKDATQLILAESDASRQLRRALRRYLRRKVHGRSVLISGHRGSGKTTLVRQAVQEAKEWVIQLEDRIPLLISLHGPDLLPTAESPQRQPRTYFGIDHDDRHRVLKRISVGLYRAISREMSRTFRERAEEATRRRVRATRAEDLSTDEFGELTVHFELALDGHLELDELRELWRRAGRLTHGILFPEPRLPGQGAREIAALASAARAYRRITGRGVAADPFRPLHRNCDGHWDSPEPPLCRNRRGRHRHRNPFSEPLATRGPEADRRTGNFILP